MYVILYIGYTYITYIILDHTYHVSLYRHVHHTSLCNTELDLTKKIYTYVTYCWWTKSCTTKDDDYPIIYRVLTIPGGAGFRPSTVCISTVYVSSQLLDDQLIFHPMSQPLRQPFRPWVPSDFSYVRTWGQQGAVSSWPWWNLLFIYTPVN